MKLQDRYSAYAVLKGPDTIPRTNPTVIAAQFRESVSMGIVVDTLGEKIGDSETKRLMQMDSEPTLVDKMIAEAANVGKSISRKA